MFHVKQLAFFKLKIAAGDDINKLILICSGDKQLPA